VGSADPGAPGAKQANLVFLCTGNAARSVMAGRLMEASGIPASVVTAGTHVVENQPMSRRTRAGMLAVGVEPGHHRSHQLVEPDVSAADLIIAMEVEHVRYVRRHFPEAAARTATIRYVDEHLSDGSDGLTDRVAKLRLDEVAPEDQLEIDDPAGFDEPEYIACAQSLSDILQRLAPRLRA
jgi:protein-tyrosine-phosphatase